MKPGRMAAVIMITAGAVAVTIMVGLVTNMASSQSHWPGPLRYAQDNPWFSLTVTGVIATVLTVLLARMTGDATASPVTAVPVHGNRDAPGGVLVLRSLPRDATAFVNREQELSRLIDLVKSAQETGGPLPVHAIDGMAGVGKTTFVVRAGHLLKDRFPDGQLFVNLNGYTAGSPPVAPTDTLASLLVASGMRPQEIPSGTDQGAILEARAAIWRDRLADRKVLLVLDNASGYGQVAPLLPGSGGCLVLVTSRKRLAVHEEVVTEMSALPRDEAIALFVRLSGRPAESLGARALESVVEHAGNLPLAISLLAARLRNHSAWSVEDLETRLLAAQDRLGEIRSGDLEVAAAFNLSYQDLPEPARRFFRRLGLFPGTFVDTYLAAALDGCSIAEAQRRLESLYDDHLIEESAAGRYRLHDLVRDFARSLAGGDDEEQRAEVTGRLRDYYLTAIAVADMAIARTGSDTVLLDPGRQAAASLPSLDTRENALRWLEEERANVLAYIDHAARTGSLSTAIRLTAAIAPYLRHAGPWDQAVQLHRSAAAWARQIDDRRALAQALTNLGVAQRLLADYPVAIEVLDEALSEYRQAGDRASQGIVLNQLGIALYLASDYERSERAQIEALTVCRAHGDRLGVANALADLGMVYRKTSRYDASVEAQTEALSIYQDLGDVYGQANALRDLGVVHGIMGEYSRAVDRHTEALRLYRELDDRLHQAYALNELGLVHRIVGERERAWTAHEEALESYTELGDRYGRADSLRHLGALHQRSGRQAEATTALSEAIMIFTDLGSRDGQAATLNEIGVTRQADGDRSAAEQAFGQALSLFRAFGDRWGEATTLNNLGELLIATGSQAAPARFEGAIRLAKAIRCPIEEARAHFGLGRCHANLGDQPNAITAMRDALTIYERLGLTEEAGLVRRLLAEQD